MKPKVVGIITDWRRHDGSEGYGGVGWYRVINPLSKLGYEWLGNMSLGTPQLALDLKEKGDIWFWKPVDNEGMNVIIDTAKEFTGAKMVLDLDDEPFDINKDHPQYDEIKSKSERVRRMIEISDHIVVSNPILKESLQEFKKPITVIPNAIDPEIWKVKKKERTDGKVRIGWIGSSSHIADIPVVEGAVREILDKYDNVEFYFAGFVVGDFGGDESYKGRVFNKEGTVNYQQFPQFFADLGLDIAIAPLLDTKFNHSKTPIKWFEGAMLEIPMVLSGVTPYKEVVKANKTGYLANSKSQWVKYLSWLIESPEKRKEIGKAAKKEVLAHHTIDKQLPKYEKLFNSLTKKDITVYTAMAGDFDHLEDPQEDFTANYVSFTDQVSDVWEVRKPYDKFKNDRRNSRIQKLMPHLYLDTKYSIYMDANIRLKVPAQKLVDEFLKDKDVAVFRHIGRDCVYNEAEACVALQKGDPNEIATQIRAYAAREYPRHAGMAECGMIVRRHTPEIARMNEKWWAEYCRHSERDQLSFPIAFDLEKVNLIESSVWRHPYFEVVGHKDEKNNVRHKGQV